jgi:hypothetical protein
VDLRVVVDEGQVLTLFLSEFHDALKQNEKITCPERVEGSGGLKVRFFVYQFYG